MWWMAAAQAAKGIMSKVGKKKGAFGAAVSGGAKKGGPRPPEESMSIRDAYRPYRHETRWKDIRNG